MKDRFKVGSGTFNWRGKEREREREAIEKRERRGGGNEMHFRRKGRKPLLLSPSLYFPCFWAANENGKQWKKREIHAEVLLLLQPGKRPLSLSLSFSFLSSSSLLLTRV